MTRSLRCRDVERLMLEGEDRAFAAGEKRIVDEHLCGCARCREFAADRALVRGEVAGIRWPAPPEDLVQRTRRLLREPDAVQPRAAVPAWVLVTMAVVTIVTAFWLAVSLANVTPDMTLADLPAAGLAAVFIIIQNALMLFCAPVVLRAVRARRGELESARS